MQLPVVTWVSLDSCSAIVEALAATPEDRPLIATVKQSPPVSFSSNSLGSESPAAAAAAAAVAAVSDASPPDAAEAAEPGAAADELAHRGSLHSHAIESALSTEVDGLPPSKDASAAVPAAAAAPQTAQAATASIDGGSAGGNPAAEQPAAAATGTVIAPGTQPALPQQAPSQPIVVQAKPRPPPEPLQRGELLDAFK